MFSICIQVPPRPWHVELLVPFIARLADHLFPFALICKSFSPGESGIRKGGGGAASAASVYQASPGPQTGLGVSRSSVSICWVNE